MANESYTVDNTDVAAETFNVPGVVSSDSGFQVEPEPLGDTQHWYVHIENGFDANVDVTIQGTHYDDASLSAPADDGATETVNAGANATFDGTSGHSYIRVEAITATDPTSGELTITYQARKA